MYRTTPRKLAAELIGTAFLLAAVVGSGIMAENLAGSNVAVALLGNSIATGAILVVLIVVFAPISGPHFNPAVTVARSFTDTFSGIAPAHMLAFIAAQIAAALLTVAVLGWLFAKQQ